MQDAANASEQASVIPDSRATGSRPPVASHTSQPSTSYRPAGNDGPAVLSPGGLDFYEANPNKGAKAKEPFLYQCYKGPASKHPDIHSWITFDEMFDINTAIMARNDGPDLIRMIRESILRVSAAARVDARMVLAQVMQESSGNVNVPCTHNGVLNCGLMQAFSGSVSYDPTRPAASIEQMIKDGTQGTARGGGMVQVIDDTRSGGNIFVALRLYNSGTVNMVDLSDARGATASYVSDMANRVLGWNGYSRRGCFGLN